MGKFVDSKELELPETKCVMDIEVKVLQGIVLQALAKIEGISLLGGTLMDSILGRDPDRIKGVQVEQKENSIVVKVEINIKYGIPIPDKSEEVQAKIIEELTRLTGFHVSNVHVIFKNLLQEKKEEELETEGV